MKKIWILIMLLFLPVVYSLQECQRVNEPSNFPCNIVSSYLPTNCTVPIFIYNESGNLLETRNWTNNIVNCVALFNISNMTMQTYYYNSTIENGIITMRFGDLTPLVAIIFLPIIFGILIFVGAMYLGKEHPAFKWFAFLLLPITVLSSFHMAVQILIKYYVFPELQDLVGTTVYWIGLLIILILVYAMMYAFTVMVRRAAQDKNDKLEY